jgi:superfamily I DNA and/or RNA helicase
MLSKVEQLLKLVKNEKNSKDDPKNISCKEVNNEVLKGENCKFFEDVIGLHEQKEQIVETFIKPIIYPTLYGELSKGILFYGPPGTGKTTTLIEAVFQLCELKKRILIAAPSNTAVDHFALQLNKQHPKINILRVGNNSKVNEQILPFTPEGKLKNSKEEKEIKRLKIQAEELRKMAHQYKRNFGKDERDQRNLLIKEVKNIRKQIRDIQEYNEEKLFEQAQVILGTPIALSDVYRDIDTRMYVLLIDEAGQCLEPLAWCIFPFAERIILAGDHFQLPPTILSQEAIQLGFNRSILEVCAENLQEINLLNVQYRMKEPIVEFSNRYFYKGKVQSETSLLSKDEHFYFFDTAGAGCDEESGEDGSSLINDGEITAISKLIQQYNLTAEKTVLISPYAGQVALLKTEFSTYQSKNQNSYFPTPKYFLPNKHFLPILHTFLILNSHLPPIPLIHFFYFYL